MAVLASKAPYGSSMGIGPTQPSVISQYAVNFANHKTSAAQGSQNAAFLSPTESEFSEPSDGQDSIRYAMCSQAYSGRLSLRERLLIAICCSSWDEKRVGEWLRAINCAQYEQLFKGTIFSSINSVTCGDT